MNSKPIFWTPEKVAWLREQIEAARPHGDIARELGIDVARIRTAAFRNGIKSPRRTTRWSKEHVETFYRMIAEGKNKYEISEALGKTVISVCQYAIQRDVKIPHVVRFPPITIAISNRILQLHDQQWLTRHIAKEVGISQSRVRAHLKENGRNSWAFTRNGKTHTMRSWTKAEMNELYEAQARYGTRMILRRLGRTRNSVISKLFSEGATLSQGRMTQAELMQDLGISYPTLARRMKALKIPSRRVDSRGVFNSRGFMPTEVVRIAQSLLDDPGQMILNQKKLRALIAENLELIDPGASNDD